MCTDGERKEECDDTASPNDGSPSENGDSEVHTNYSLSVYSYLVSSNSNSDLLCEVNNMCIEWKTKF